MLSRKCQFGGLKPASIENRIHDFFRLKKLLMSNLLFFKYFYLRAAEA